MRYILMSRSSKPIQFLKYTNIEKKSIGVIVLLVCKMVRYWIHTTSIPNWEYELNHDPYIVGLSEYDSKKSKQVREHDRVAIYLARRPKPDDPRVMHFSGTFLFQSRFIHEDSQRWAGGNFPLRAALKPILMTNEVMLMVPVVSIIDKLEFVKKKQRWGVYFQSSLISISENDWNTIQNELAKRIN